MPIRRLTVTGLLSFGPRGVDLPMEPLTVLIGPNGSGKSNLLEVIALLRAAPRSLAEPVRRRGGVWEWLWKGDESQHVATLDAILERPRDTTRIRHKLAFRDEGGRLTVTGEEITSIQDGRRDAESYCRLHSNLVAVGTGGPSAKPRGDRPVDPVGPGPKPPIGFGPAKPRGDRPVDPEESILSQLRDPLDYPALSWLQEQYERIRLYRNWSFGPTADLRRDQSAHGPTDFLNDGADNLALVLSHFKGEAKRQLVEALHELYEGIVDVSCPVTGGTVALFLEESDGRQIPASLLSDGTLRYLSLLAILLHPTPPPLIGLEEPELGLHPDVVAVVAKLLVQASARTQIVVTTHSRMLVDALTDHPSSVVVCEKDHGESRFERLDGTRLKAWLDKYSLGELWSSGELGGNRW